MIQHPWTIEVRQNFLGYWFYTVTEDAHPENDPIIGPDFGASTAENAKGAAEALIDGIMARRKATPAPYKYIPKEIPTND